MILGLSQIQIQNSLNKIKWSYRKNAPDLKGVFLRNYPDFVLSAKPTLEENELPVFVFHTVEPLSFEAQLQFLSDNHYLTLTAGEFYEIVTKQKKKSTNAILLTFDDGTRNLWTVAYPLLKKYKMKAVSFILPGLIPDGKTMHFNLEDVWHGKITFEEIAAAGKNENPMCNWEEITEMHKSGVIDFQSHTMYHALIPVSNKIHDFFNPDFNPYFFGNIHVPLYREGDKDLFDRKLKYGTPIYCSEPRMSQYPRYFDDENVRTQCQQFVEDNGGKDFFKKKNWRRELTLFFRKVAKSKGLNEKYENSTEQMASILSELKLSKLIIESKLAKKVDHLCYPWFIGSSLSVRLSKEVGYKSNFWGMLPHTRENRIGMDPFKITRLEDRFIYRLPGEGRKSLVSVFQEKWENYGIHFKILKKMRQK